MVGGFRDRNVRPVMYGNTELCTSTAQKTLKKRDTSREKKNCLPTPEDQAFQGGKNTVHSLTFTSGQDGKEPDVVKTFHTEKN